MLQNGLLRLSAMVALLALALYFDLSRRRIPHWLTFGGIAVGLGLAVADALYFATWSAMIPSVVGLVIGFVIFLLPFYFGWLGGGDMMLMAAIGSLQGVAPTFLRKPFPGIPIMHFPVGFIVHAVFWSAFAGACLALIILIWEGRLLSGLRSSLGLIVHPKRAVENESHTAIIPYGVAIAVGTFWSLLLGMKSP